MNILCIEPDINLAQTYSEAFQLAGHATQMAHTAQSALDSADDKPPDLVILELQLPGANGIAFLHEFRSYTDWQLIPVVVHSYAMPDDRPAIAAALKEQLGVIEWLYKPQTTIKQLLTVISRYQSKGSGLS